MGLPTKVGAITKKRRSSSLPWETAPCEQTTQPTRSSLSISQRPTERSTH